MSRTAKRTVVICVLLIAGLFALAAIVHPYLPGNVTVRIADPEGEAHYKELLLRHGQKFHYGKNVRGERVFIIEGITDLQVTALQCDYLAWQTPRLQAQGVVVTENRECKP